MERSAADEEGLERLEVLTGHSPGIDRAIPSRFHYSAAGVPSGATLACSARDLGQYLIAMVNQGRVGDVQVIAPDALNEMMTPAIDFPCPVSFDKGGDRSTWHYGMGWMIAEIDGRRLVLHEGDTGLAGSIAMIDPARSLGVCIVRNSSDVDPYKFPTLITMANNVLHLAAGESPTNFGVPRSPEPTLNEFRPSRNLLERCVGRYVSQTGASRLDVALHPAGDGLFAETGGGALRTEGLIDFRDESLFDLRNVQGARRGLLRKLPDGTVVGFQLGTEKFRRVSKSVPDGYQEVKAIDMRSLVVPVGWEVDWQGPSFTASAPGDRRTIIDGQILYDFERPLERIAEGLHETGTVVDNGPIMSSAIGGMIWRQQGSIVTRGDEKWQRLIAYIRFEDRLIFVTLRTPFGALTKEEQRILLPLMSAWGNDRYFAPFGTPSTLSRRRRARKLIRTSDRQLGEGISFRTLAGNFWGGRCISPWKCQFKISRPGRCRIDLPPGSARFAQYGTMNATPSGRFVVGLLRTGRLLLLAKFLAFRPDGFVRQSQRDARGGDSSPMPAGELGRLHQPLLP